MNLRRAVYSLLLLGACTLGAIKLKAFCYAQTGGFALYKICSSLAFNPAWEVASLGQGEEAELDLALSQPYHFLAKGAQCFVFSSEDGHHVIKFFKLSHLLPPVWLNNMRLPFALEPMRIKKIAQKREELNRDFLSYKIAYEELRDQTGMLFLHLNKTHCLKRHLTVIDRLGISYDLDLDNMEFLVQKQASLFYPFIEKTLAEKGEEGVKVIISDLVSLLALRNRKGIFDKDPDINSNFGFLNNRCAQIDIGRFRKDLTRCSPDVYRPEILRITDSFNQWLQPRSPALSKYLEHEIQSS